MSIEDITMCIKLSEMERSRDQEAKCGMLKKGRELKPVGMLGPDKEGKVLLLSRT
jgi:hypothetical protein